jgi:hypothetical protein
MPNIRPGLLVALLFAATSTTAVAQERRAAEIEDMFLLRDIGAPVVSPGRARIAYTVTRTSLEDEESRTRIHMVSRENHLDRIRPHGVG